MADSELIYLEHDNKIDQILTEDGSAVDLLAVNRMTIQFNDLIIDSNVAGEGVGEPFDWTSGDGLLILDLSEEGIPVGTYRAELIVHSADNPNGVVWGKLRIKVVDIPYTPV